MKLSIDIATTSVDRGMGEDQPPFPWEPPLLTTEHAQYAAVHLSCLKHGIAVVVPMETVAFPMATAEPTSSRQQLLWTYFYCGSFCMHVACDSM